METAERDFAEQWLGMENAGDHYALCWESKVGTGACTTTQAAGLPSQPACPSRRIAPHGTTYHIRRCAADASDLLYPWNGCSQYSGPSFTA